MAYFNHGWFRDGMVFGTHDVGYVSWSIRWSSAGWSLRDAMWVWIHNGVLINTLGNGHFDGAEMDKANNGRYAIVDIDSKYLNKAGDNPGITSILIPWCFNYDATVIYGYWYNPIYVRSIAISLARFPASYDVGQCLKMYFGLQKNFDCDASMICSELVWHLVAGTEKMMGLRKYGSIPTALGRTLRTTGISDYVPAYWYDAWRGRDRFGLRYGLCAWNCCGSPDVSTPYGQQINQTWSAGISGRGSFVG
jgi:hypothetical protein